MKLNLVIEKNCAVCARVQSALENIAYHGKEFELIIHDIETQNKFSVQIVPALFIEDRLFAIGEFDLEKLKNNIS